MKKYYITVGDNGGVITDDYDRALLCKKYFRGHVYVKNQSTFEDAEEYLLNHLIEKAPFWCPVPDHYALNAVVTIRKLMECY